MEGEMMFMMLVMMEGGEEEVVDGLFGVHGDGMRLRKETTTWGLYRNESDHVPEMKVSSARGTLDARKRSYRGDVV
jgi:hypothetical protein